MLKCGFALAVMELNVAEHSLDHFFFRHYVPLYLDFIFLSPREVV